MNNKNTKNTICLSIGHHNNSNDTIMITYEKGSKFVFYLIHVDECIERYYLYVYITLIHIKTYIFFCSLQRIWIKNVLGVYNVYPIVHHYKGLHIIFQNEMAYFTFSDHFIQMWK